eukprot:CAMPEP_0195508988 /NCGR_PEP_ID=MMETSP0794_2-20130614/2052_1 /TAXON_ID=515487 /ORGANISM="Stephanopyxis turris, Strain CCMP 815" /LENGTH=689 /DNA_ID=CAMNT_0040636093 /DNA_START=154 /DNA_END=2223 /DNA_ORIENTATION=-
MTSKEAVALESSTTSPPYSNNNNNSSSSSSSTTSWKHMNTKSGHKISDTRNKKQPSKSQAQSLTSTKRRKRQSGNSDDDDIDDDEEEERYDENEEDEFFDRPHSHLYPVGGGGAIQLLGIWLTRFFHGPVRKLFIRLYGNDVPMSEVRRVFMLSTTLFFMIGGYWLLRSLKDPVLTSLCGVSVIPKAKMLSVGVVLVVVSIYNQLLGSSIPKHKLFYLFGTFYFCVFAMIARLLKDPEIGLANQSPDPTRVLGWVSYCAIESFGSVMVSLFWSFANSVCSLETSKASYGMMVATAQIGSIMGPTVVSQYAVTMGVPACYMAGAGCMLMLQITMWTYIQIYGTGMPKMEGDDDDQEDEHAASKTVLKKKGGKSGVLEGLFLFWKYNYIKGIFAISCLFMVEVTIVDYTMKVLAKDHFSELYPCSVGESCWDRGGMSTDATAAFTTFMGLFGQATNTLSFLMSLLGTSAIIRTLGLRLTLLLFPSLCLAIIIMVRASPTLWVVFGAMMMLKASSYALNNPTKEILYQPTSHAVKFKAKSWIDIFGARGSKALGSVVTNAFSDSAEALVTNGSLVGMAVASFLIWNARYMGKTFDQYIQSGYIVGGDADQMEEEDMMLVSSDDVDPNGQDDDESNGLQMAMDQNEDGKDTSCAIYDDTQVGALEEGQSFEEENEEEDQETVQRNPSPVIASV